MDSYAAVVYDQITVRVRLLDPSLRLHCVARTCAEQGSPPIAIYRVLLIPIAFVGPYAMESIKDAWISSSQTSEK